MHIKKVEIENFKCIEKLEFSPKKINLIVGRNDAGKTSLLEALDSMYSQEKTIEKCRETLPLLINAEGETAKIKCRINGSDLTVRMKRPEEGAVLFEFKKEFIEALKSYCGVLRINFSQDAKINSVLDGCLDETLMPLLKEGSITVSVNGESRTYFAFADRIMRKIEGPVNELYELVHRRKRIKEESRGRRIFLFFDMLMHFLKYPASSKSGSDELGSEKIMFLEDFEVPPKEKTTKKDAIKIKELDDFIKSEKLLDGIEKFDLDYLILNKNGKRTSMPFHMTGDGFNVMAGFLWQTAPHSVKNRIFLIEEPERGMHPGLMLKLVKAITAFSKEKNLQFFMTTHNADFIDLFFDESIKPEFRKYLTENFSILRMEQGRAIPECLDYGECLERKEALHLDLRGI